MINDVQTIVYCLIALVIFAIGIRSGQEIERSNWHQWAIENNYAHYDTQTGEFILDGVTSQ